MAVKASQSRLDSTRLVPPRPEDAVIAFSLKNLPRG
jgi:hypothetical protein